MICPIPNTQSFNPMVILGRDFYRLGKYAPESVLPLSCLICPVASTSGGDHLVIRATAALEKHFTIWPPGKWWRVMFSCQTVSCGLSCGLSCDINRPATELKDPCPGCAFLLGVLLHCWPDYVFVFKLFGHVSRSCGRSETPSAGWFVIPRGQSQCCFAF